MPIEYEFKYVLLKDIAQSSTFLGLKAQMPVREIRQGYLQSGDDFNCRVRLLREDGGPEQWFFTFKQKVGDRLVEIETPITPEDATYLWVACPKTLKKHRYIYDVKGMKWELDLFYDQKGGGELYFAMVEIELEEGSSRPEVPYFIKPFVLYEVPLTDDRFSNKRLVDAEYARQLYEEVVEHSM